MRCSLPLCCAVPCHTVACCAVPCCAVPCVRCHAVLCHASGLLGLHYPQSSWSLDLSSTTPAFHNPQPTNSAHEDGKRRLCFLDAVCHALQAKAKVNVGFWGGITPDNAHKHDVLWAMLQVWHL